MKYLLLSLTFFILFSCTKKKDPVIDFTVTQNAAGVMVLNANISGVSAKKINFCGFTCGLSEVHSTELNQVVSSIPNSNSITLTMSNYDYGNGNYVDFSPNTTYYFTCIVGTSDGKFYRTKVKSLLTESNIPCNLNNNTYTVVSQSNSSPIDYGASTIAYLSASSNSYKTYNVQFGQYQFKFTFLGQPTSQIYTTTTSSTGFTSNRVYIKNTFSSATLDNNANLYVTNNLDGTFTMEMCEGNADDWVYSPSYVTYSFKVNGNY
jgi:hypothetical protein